jgi:predicted helicase
MTKNAEFYYFTLADDLPRKDKLHWFDTTKFKDIPFERIHPDEKGNWLNLTDNDFESLMPVCDKEVKAGKSKENNAEAIFKLYSLGVVTSRDEWVYDYDKQNLENKIEFFFDTYNSEIKRWEQSTENKEVINFVDRTIKWTSELEAHLTKGHKLTFDKNCVISSLYRPFIKQFFYFDKIITHRIYQNDSIFGFKNKHENTVICLNIGSKDFNVLSAKSLPDYHFNGDSQCLPLYVYDETGKPQENITNWALNQFKNRYACELTKTDIFHYVYAVLHNPVYREKYEQNLKREFPRVPFYNDFSQWVEWGKTLMDLHLNYETIEPYPLKRVDSKTSKLPKAKLKADKTNGVIELDENTSLSGIPVEAWDYKLGNRSALEWILDQYKEKKPKDATIAEKFNVYHFSDYKESVIDLLTRVCLVSVETVKITKQMKSKDI